MNPEPLRNRILAADLAWIPLALAAEQELCSGLRWSQPRLGTFNFTVYVVATAMAWILLSENMHLDGFRGGWRLPALISHLLLGAAVLMVLLLAVEEVSGRYLGQVTLSVFSLVLLAGFFGIRWFALATVRRRYRNGDVKRVVILGSDRLAAELANKFSRHPELLCKVVGFLCPKAEVAAPRPRPTAGDRNSSDRNSSDRNWDARNSGTVSTVEITDLLCQQKIDELVLALSLASPEILNLVAHCRQRAIRVSLVPQPYELYLSRPSLLDLGGLPLLQLGEMAPPASARIGKRVLDVALGSALALASLPIVLGFAAALRSSRGRAFRWERRIGWQGKQFSMLRLNVARNPPPGRPLERWLWHSSISELPQFWNVLRGDMSLVGPRPEGPERADHYSSWQQQRLAVKPGLTGLAQVHGLREQHSSEDKTRHDLQYMLRASLLKDLSLLIETVWTLAFRLIKMPAPIPHALKPSYLHPKHGAATSVRTAAPAILYSPVSPVFPEIFQHAHRTQSGTD
jgi:lipopolysaccharide/colanic/teichoic acid biosynthesis glycosyltransferase